MKKVKNEGVKFASIRRYFNSDTVVAFHETREEAERELRDEGLSEACNYAFVCRIESMWTGVP